MMDFRNLLTLAKVNPEYELVIIDMYRPLLIKEALIEGVYDADLYQELLIVCIRCIHSFKV